MGFCCCFIVLCLLLRRRVCLFTCDFPFLCGMGCDSPCSDHPNISYLMSSLLLRSPRVWWNLGLSCLLLGENSCFSSQKLIYFCLNQFVGLGISSLGELGCEWEVVNTGGWNTRSKGLNYS